MDYLNQDHPVLRGSPSKLRVAWDAVLERALGRARSFYIEFDRDRLVGVVGNPMLARLLGDSAGAAGSGATLYETRSEPLDPDRADVLRQLLSFDLGLWADLPLNYIQTVMLFDEDSHLIWRGGDYGAAILFSLPEPERDGLLRVYEEAAIPAQVVERVNIAPSLLVPR